MLGNKDIVRVIKVKLSNGEVIKMEVVEHVPVDKDKGSGVVASVLLLLPMGLMLIDYVIRAI